MEILSGEKTAEHLKNIIHFDTQVSENGFDLTVGKIYKIEGSGEIDFGGSERKDANISEIEPELRDSNDDYGWWELKPGTYFIEHNEDLDTNNPSFLQPLSRLTRNSATHPAKFVQELGLVSLYVGEPGISIKENSRISRLLVFES